MRAILTGLLLTCGVPLCTAVAFADEAPDPFREYKGKEPVPAGLREAYTGFVRAAKDGNVESFCLPHAVTTSHGARPEKSREYGQDINLPFLRDGFSPVVQTVRKDPDDCYLIRAGSTAIWFVQNKSGEWKVYRYLDKPIQ